jgi:hypothetical protein
MSPGNQGSVGVIPVTVVPVTPPHPVATVSASAPVATHSASVSAPAALTATTLTTAAAIGTGKFTPTPSSPGFVTVNAGGRVGVSFGLAGLIALAAAAVF